MRRAPSASRTAGCRFAQSSRSRVPSRVVAAGSIALSAIDLVSATCPGVRWRRRGHQCRKLSRLLESTTFVEQRELLVARASLSSIDRLGVHDERTTHGRELANCRIQDSWRKAMTSHVFPRFEFSPGEVQDRDASPRTHALLPERRGSRVERRRCARQRHFLNAGRWWRSEVQQPARPQGHFQRGRRSTP